MFDFVVTFPFLRNCIKGCHGNRAFSHSPNRFIFGETFFRIEGILGNSVAPMKNCPGWVQGK